MNIRIKRQIIGKKISDFQINNNTFRIIFTDNSSLTLVDCGNNCCGNSRTLEQVVDSSGNYLNSKIIDVIPYKNYPCPPTSLQSIHYKFILENDVLIVSFINRNVECDTADGFNIIANYILKGNQ
jgi:hypothetical protein